MKTVVIIGASKGLGNSLIDGLGEKEDQFYLISRSKPHFLQEESGFDKYWIQADLSEENGLLTILETLRDRTIDVLIFNAGIWEKEPFESVSAKEINTILQVNVGSSLLLSQQLLPALRKGHLKKIIFIGSTCGLENEGGDAVVYHTTKFALRGLTHALRAYTRKDLIAVSCISPGSIASEIPFRDGMERALEKHQGKRLPVHDLVALIQMIIRSSYAACLKEVHLPSILDEDV